MGKTTRHGRPSRKRTHERPANPGWKTAPAVNEDAKELERQWTGDFDGQLKFTSALREMILLYAARLRTEHESTDPNLLVGASVRETHRLLINIEAQLSRRSTKIAKEQESFEDWVRLMNM